MTLTYQDLARLWWLAEAEHKPLSHVTRDIFKDGIPKLAKRKQLQIPAELLDLDEAKRFLDSRTSPK